MSIGSTSIRKLDRADAVRIAHEVACWIEYERGQGSFQHVVRLETGLAWIQTWTRTWYVGRFLRGACCIAAYIVVRVLNERGYDATIRYVPGHYFARTACGTRVDPTWSQFDHESGPRVDRRKPTKHELTLELQSMVRLPKNWHPHGCWPGNHLKAIERILRRMGVENYELPKSTQRRGQGNRRGIIESRA
jgi:hypothetical protein